MIDQTVERHYLYRQAYATGGSLSVTVDDDDNASIEYHWQVQGSGPYVAFALPHHRQTLSSKSKFDTGLSVVTPLAGTLQAVVGTSWLMTEKLSSLSRSFWDTSASFTSAQTSAIVAQLALDAPTAPIANQDPYTFGKLIARLARLALIADQFGQSDIASSTRSFMKTSLEVALGLSGASPDNQDPLLYDTRYGGVVSTQGVAIPGVPWGSGSAADFGNGIYNDHHYHYGYWIYAVAAVVKAEPQWWSSNAQLQNRVLALVRDIANPSDDDPYFTAMRHKDWFMFHSWASGLQPVADGANQESISEAINAYYGVALLGEAIGDGHMSDVGRVLLTTEIRAAQSYWQVLPTDYSIYPPSFAQLGMAAQRYADKATYAVFFECPGVTACTYGINIIPVTPITTQLLPKPWVQATYTFYASANFVSLEQWRAFLIADHAIIDKNAAWSEAMAYTGPYDGGVSLTNELYFVASQH